MTVANSIFRKNIARNNRKAGQRKSPARLQEDTLSQLIKSAERTDFGQRYGFSYLLGEQDLIKRFRKQVPIFRYDDIFEQYWKRSLHGETNVSWKGRVKFFALSSGTSGAASKYIPITSDMQRAMRRSALKFFSCLPKYDIPPKLFFKDWLMIGGSADLKQEGAALVGDLSGINTRNQPIWTRKFFKPGLKAAMLPTWDERSRYIVRHAPKWDISVMSGIPSWVQLTLEHIVAYHKLDNIHEIWPNLSVFMTGGVAFEPYRNSLEKLLAQPLIYQDSYLASEGFIAFQNRPDTSHLTMILNGGIFYEFVPFTSDNFDEEGNIRSDAKSLTIEEVQEGVDYALLISTCAGAWRYLIGDTIRFMDKSRREITITGRTKHFLSVCGEHLSVDNMNQAIRHMERQLNFPVREFTVGAVKSGSHFAHRWYIGSDEDRNPDLLKHVLDEELKKINDDYRCERSAMLREPDLRIIPLSWFYDWQREIGRMNGQSKIPRVMKGEKLQSWERFIAAKQATLLV